MNGRINRRIRQEAVWSAGHSIAVKNPRRWMLSNAISSAEPLASATIFWSVVIQIGHEFLRRPPWRRPG